MNKPNITKQVTISATDFHSLDVSTAGLSCAGAVKHQISSHVIHIPCWTCPQIYIYIYIYHACIYILMMYYKYSWSISHIWYELLIYIYICVCIYFNQTQKKNDPKPIEMDQKRWTWLAPPRPSVLVHHQSSRFPLQHRPEPGPKSTRDVEDITK